VKSVDQTLDLLTASLLPAAGGRWLRVLLATRALGDVLSHPDHHAEALPEAAHASIRSGAARRRAEDELRRAEAAGLRIVGCDDTEYPAWLRRIFEPPLVLYVRGTLRADEGPASLAIVGSRRCSPAGLAWARAAAHDLAAAGLTIVSGLARGIDTAAHEGALATAGRTVAVLGSGLDRVYPPENGRLAAAVAERGAVVSEFPLGTGPRPEHFPRRNRLIAGWGRAVVVVEAADRSGALVTARLAGEEGRDVMAVPGHPSSPVASGANALIRDGAVLVRDAADVAQELGIALPPRAPAPASRLLDALTRDAPRGVEEILSRTGQSVQQVLAELMTLEMEDKVRRLPGALYVRN
jgi:DNA processing protein